MAEADLKIGAQLIRLPTFVFEQCARSCSAPQPTQKVPWNTEGVRTHMFTKRVPPTLTSVLKGNNLRFQGLACILALWVDLLQGCPASCTFTCVQSRYSLYPRPT